MGGTCKTSDAFRGLTSTAFSKLNCVIQLIKRKRLKDRRMKETRCRTLKKLGIEQVIPSDESALSERRRENLSRAHLGR